MCSESLRKRKERIDSVVEIQLQFHELLRADKRPGKIEVRFQFVISHSALDRPFNSLLIRTTIF